MRERSSLRSVFRLTDATELHFLPLGGNVWRAVEGGEVMKVLLYPSSFAFSIISSSSILIVVGRY